MAGLPILMVLFAYGAGTLFGVRTCLAVPMQKGNDPKLRSQTTMSITCARNRWLRTSWFA